jgi:general secretion pathway protein J
VTSFDQWKTAWAAAGLWSQSPSETAKSAEIAIANINQWQIYFYRGNAWSNPLSSSGAASTAPAGPGVPETGSAIPDGIRLSIVLDAPHPLAGTITRDWVRPTLTSGIP